MAAAGAGVRSVVVFSQNRGEHRAELLKESNKQKKGDQHAFKSNRAFFITIFLRNDGLPVVVYQLHRQTTTGRRMETVPQTLRLRLQAALTYLRMVDRHTQFLMLEGQWSPHLHQQS